MRKKVRKYIESWQMIGRGDRVIAGISGGADSICLLFVLLELKEEMGFEVAAVHVNHGLRGESAKRDEKYVREVCEKSGVRFFLFREDVGGYARSRRLSVEEAGREVRRSCMEKARCQWDGTCIALAHQQNDNAETVIFNLCRGSGLRGMGGIPPKSGVWIHPLLCLSRQEIERYLKDREISYCTDETNLEECYTRNRIRKRVIPYLEKYVNERTVEHIAQCAETIRGAGEYVEEKTAEYVKSCIKTENAGEILLREDGFKRVPETLKKGVMREALCVAAGAKRDIGAAHVAAACDLLDRQAGRMAKFPYNVEAYRNYDGLLFRNCNAAQKPGVKEKAEFWMNIFENESATFPEKNYTKWFDYDIITNICVDRKFIPLDMSLFVSERRYIAYEPCEAEHTEEEARQLLQNRLSSKLMDYEEKGYKIIDHAFDVSKEQTAYKARGKIVMSVSNMGQKDVAEEELLLKQSGKEDDDGTGADRS